MNSEMKEQKTAGGGEMATIDGSQLRNILLETVAGLAKELKLTTGQILAKVGEKAGLPFVRQNAEELLTYMYDLFRTGHLSWGFNYENPDPPWCHLTEKGRKALQAFSRDPVNPAGYLSHVSKLKPINPVALSYLKEGLSTYNSDCFRAAAVMLGAATECIILELRDTLSKRMKDLGKSPSKHLEDWKVKTALDAIKKGLDPFKKSMPNPLGEAYEAYWPAFIQQIRATRNDAGHPSNIEPVTEDSVHASLLIFPLLAKLNYELMDWISREYR
jgi:hypothetical protein